MSSGRLRFGNFEFDPQSGKLHRDNLLIRIQPQPLRVLGVLLEKPGEIVSRDELQSRIWDQATFVEFDQGLNYCIRQIRLALHDDAAAPVYIETLKRQGYRFIAPVIRETVPLDVNGVERSPEISTEAKGESSRPAETVALVGPAWNSHRIFNIAAITLIFAAVLSGSWLYLRVRTPTVRERIDIFQITDFADSAVAPALSPDGHMVAFIRGGSDFLTPDQIYVKMLPDGEPKQLTNDPRLKYGATFSPDGSQVAYTVMENSGWSTYTVPILGGEPRLLINNAAGLTWLDPAHVLFSQIKAGQHMGVVTGTLTRENFRELYFPAHERGMAHYSYASPDRTSALVVEMDEKPVWQQCKLISLNGSSPIKFVGPKGVCTAAGWSPDGRWMYFIVTLNGKSHLWRQRYPDGIPEQLTFGPTDELGLSVDPDGRSIITSYGGYESTLWIHEADGDHPLSSQGQVMGYEGSISVPTFSTDTQYVYYLLRRESEGFGQELWRLNVRTGNTETVIPGVSIREYNVSQDDKYVVYTTAALGEKSQMWLAAIDKSAAPQRIGLPGDTSPYFGPDGEILFRLTEGKWNYLARMKRDGSGRSRVVPYPVSTIQGISPARNWVMAVAPLMDNSTVAPMAIPVRGGPPVRICEIYCEMAWSTNGKFIFASVEEPSLSSPGRTLAIPVGPGETLPQFPSSGIRPLSEANAIPGSISVKGAGLIPGEGPHRLAYIKTTAHRNLFRVVLGT
jgi:DNA-binding winged helix-turn-helix (wHTH) protein/Tol biopolymer transport system component